VLRFGQINSIIIPYLYTRYKLRQSQRITRGCFTHRLLSSGTCRQKWTGTDDRTDLSIRREVRELQPLRSGNVSSLSTSCRILKKWEEWLSYYEFETYFRRY